MKKLLYILTILMTISWPVISGSSGVWKPELKFSLEGRTLGQTMLWVSGFSYAVDAMGRVTLAANQQRPFCAPETGSISPKILFEILNKRFMGQIISSERATEEIMQQLPAMFSC